MNPKLCIFAALMLPALGLAADNPSVHLQFGPQSDLVDVLHLYSTLTGRKIWLDLNVHANVAVISLRPIPKEEALRLIRTNLLEQYGIELRDTDKNETFVSWSDDPQYKEVRTKAEKGTAPPVFPGGAPRGRIRVLNSGEKPQ